jgi:hypothetical protein
MTFNLYILSFENSRDIVIFSRDIVIFSSMSFIAISFSDVNRLHFVILNFNSLFVVGSLIVKFGYWVQLEIIIKIYLPSGTFLFMGLNLNVYSIYSSSSVKISAQCLETHSVKLAACIYTVKKYSKKKHFIHLWNLRYRENWKLRNFDVVSFCGTVQIIIFQYALRLWCPIYSCMKSSIVMSMSMSMKNFILVG